MSSGHEAEPKRLYSVCPVNGLQYEDSAGDTIVVGHGYSSVAEDAAQQHRAFERSKM
ncbi:MAG: hypothetical protein HOG89_04740 [Candidatus Peribacter sp.]|jgi:hypothetical protein|nr:hypothetical protein [Candidatus Peribacter sp.]MBT4393512.1 hypothetical protein [Candidatus Peribacter sp.]MBT4601271.1 hypothetical protein [Candidatus Peribacter sp.]MBT5149320.1 hypothetical protein [Candidatus Peribacter sp.]MBT5638253.1 hypothetical protein [Candidatus Peribacter sp.]